MSEEYEPRLRQQAHEHRMKYLKLCRIERILGTLNPVCLGLAISNLSLILLKNVMVLHLSWVTYGSGAVALTGGICGMAARRMLRKRIPLHRDINNGIVGMLTTPTLSSAWLLHQDQTMAALNRLNELEDRKQKSVVTN